MRLKKLELYNFRGYADEEFNFEQISGIIGRNDVGKSTILDALEIFFNGESKSSIISAEIGDLRVGQSVDRVFSISCFFEIDPNEHVVIDSTNQTNLKEEYLLNNEGLLEIVKSWDCSKSNLSAKSMKVSINANIPYVGDKRFLTMNRDNLKKELDEIKDSIEDYEDVNKNLKAELRKRLYTYYMSGIEKHEELIDIKELETDDTDLWKSISKNLPLYFLFQSDRKNSDSDSEVQNPLKVAAKKAIAEKQDELEKIENYVIKEVSNVGKNTVDKLSEFDNSIASGLVTNHTTKAWESLFKFDISDDKQIPLNKRGSGIRRLILLSYFRAEAEKALEDKNSKSIIYAIEEPETSQHPDYQSMILESLQKVCENPNNQVLFTTHTPEIAKMLELNSLLFVEKNSFGVPQTEKDEKEKLRKIVKSLGILPSVTSKFVICVEGENDVEFLRGINQAIPEFSELIDLSKIPIIPMIGAKLKQWLDRNYLDGSNVKEFHIYDSDVKEYCEKVDEINKLNDGRRIGINTGLPEMENYIPPKLISEEFNITIDNYEKWK
ncbi:MAG: ATP-binding protein, partial [Tetragenococcus koreensis]|nr:ATP-binding protein [Tetragenococcus koreensis]